jgi:hypothetical protein
MIELKSNTPMRSVNLTVPFEGQPGGYGLQRLKLLQPCARSSVLLCFRG